MRLRRLIASGLFVRPSPSSSRALFSSSAALLQSRDAPALVYNEHGDPERVLSYVSDAGFGGRVDDRTSTSTSTSSSSSSSSVLVRWLASPVNWSDVNVVEGTYPGAPLPPATPGNEGAGVVEEVFEGGDGVDDDDGTLSAPLRKGDLVVPLVPASGTLGGTWRRYSMASRSDLHRIDPSLGLKAEQAATLCINPPTALHLLEDFADLQPGSTLIQTGATTAVGKLVIQLASSRNVSTVNVVRDRRSDEELSKVKRDLEELGASDGGKGGDRGRVVVVSESEVAGMRSFGDLVSSLSLPCSSSLAPPSLALNCTGGTSASSALRILSPGSHFVTYGGLSKKPLMVPASSLIFKDIKFVGFWLSKGLLQKSDDGGENEGRRRVSAAALQRRRSDLDRVASLVSRGVISTEVERVPMERWQEALEGLRKGGTNARKQVLVP